MALTDKLNNIRAIASDYAEIGGAIRERCNRGRDAQKGYDQSLVQALCDDSAEEACQGLHNQFAQVVSEVFETET